MPKRDGVNLPEIFRPRRDTTDWSWNEGEKGRGKRRRGNDCQARIRDRKREKKNTSATISSWERQKEGGFVPSKERGKSLVFHGHSKQKAGK